MDPHLIRFLSQGPLSEKILVGYDLVDNSITVYTVGGEITVDRVKPLIRKLILIHFARYTLYRLQTYLIYLSLSFIVSFYSCSYMSYICYYNSTFTQFFTVKKNLINSNSLCIIYSTSRLHSTMKLIVYM